RRRCGLGPGSRRPGREVSGLPHPTALSSCPPLPRADRPSGSSSTRRLAYTAVSVRPVASGPWPPAAMMKRSLYIYSVANSFIHTELTDRAQGDRQVIASQADWQAAAQAWGIAEPPRVNFRTHFLFVHTAGVGYGPLGFAL